MDLLIIVTSKKMQFKLKSEVLYRKKRSNCELLGKLAAYTVYNINNFLVHFSV